MDDVYKNIKEYNPNKKRKLIIIFDDMIFDMPSNKKPNPIVTKLFVRNKKLNISYVFITQSYPVVPKKYYTKLYTLFPYEYFKQTRPSTSCLQSFIRY